MRNKENFFDRQAKKLMAKVVGDDDETRNVKSTDDKPEDDPKADPKKDDKSDKGNAKDGKSEDSKAEPKGKSGKSDDKSDKDDAKDSKPEDDPKADPKKDDKSDKGNAKDVKPAPAPAPAASYTGAGDINGVRDLRQHVTINGDVQVTQYGGTSLSQSAVGDKLDAFVKSIEQIRFTRAEEDSFRNGDALYELNRAANEGEVPSAAIKFAELTFLKCPEKTFKFIMEHFSEAIEAFPELIVIAREADARKHQIEHRFVPDCAPETFWEESAARAYIDEQKAELKPSLAAKAEDSDFGRWTWVEVNGDTGKVTRELSPEEAAAHEASKTAPANPKGGKKTSAKKSKPEGEA